MFDKIFTHKNSDFATELSVIGLNKKVQAAYVWDLFNVIKGSILVVTSNLYDANNLYKSLNFYLSDVLLFPMDDFLASEAIAISPELMATRIDTLNELSSCKKNRIIITNLMGYLRFLPSVRVWNQSKTILKTGQFIDKNNLIQKLSKIGYKKETMVTKTGEYATRGYVLDIFPYGNDQPVRIEFFDNEIEKIKVFNSETQLSIETITSIKIDPFTEFINDQDIMDTPCRQSLLPSVTEEVSSIKDYIKNAKEVFIDINDIKFSNEKILEEVIEFKKTDLFKIDNYMHSLNKIISQNYINILDFNNCSIKSKNTETYYTKQIDNFNGNFEIINEYIKTNLYKNKTVVLCLKSKKLISEFAEYIKVKYVITNINNIYEKSLNIVNFNMPNGFVINNYVYITEAELFKKSMSTAYKSKFKYGSKIRDINKLRIGDYVVHINHGIGKYLGIVTLTSNGLKKDYIYLQYKNNDKLYIPVEKIELISKYSSNEGIMPGLSKLGGTEWEKQKLRVKGKVKDIAKELLDLSIKRSSQVGFSFIKDDDEQIKFESDFIYAETKDQLTATNDIKKDMESIHPMDRLLCGDVGYGKTEVAFRAIFKAIKSGKQVAYLCPTTILSKQHYENALQRFFGFGINIEVLNRFVSDKKKKEVLKNLANGQIDLIIGTHRLLSKDIVYKDLGLLVIDEEQRFGVTHKEKIKSYKANIDVLTLSATPIPRTLQMSLTGIRGLSLIETPPVDRYPIQTYVLRENDQVIKDAIYKELSRNGQVFILNNRVSKMDSEISRIKKLVPEALVSCIHGQMNKSQIEETMERFVSKEYDVLICTTIIETGIDIQNANTLIVIDADCFGLSQLYQIRGRIGRGQKIGYAYLMYNKNKELSEIAVKRLSAIKEFTELGSGYALAVRDLSIRGAGDVLGMEQSGFIDTIGYDMYIKILNEEVSKLKGENVIEENTSEEKPFIQVATHIDDNYAPNEEVKIDLHKKINTIKNYADFNSVKEEIKDRFGKVDEALIVYMLEELFQALAPLKGVEKVEQKDKIITVVFSKEKSAVIDGHKLLINLFNITPNFGISYLKDKIQITLKTNNLDKHFMYYIIEMIEKIA